MGEARTHRTRSTPPARLAAAALIVGIAGLQAGCGWTARDEYRRVSKITVSASAGDGSMGVFATDRDSVPRGVSTARTAAVPDR